GNKRFLGILAAIAAWREREAQTRDVPRNRVIRDEALLEIAAHPPDSANGLERIRAVPKGFAASRSGRALMDAITEGLSGPAPKPLEQDHTRRRREPSPSAIDLLKTLLRLKAEEARVAPRLIASSDDIEKLAAFEDEGVAALHGWRAEVFGNDALALRNGTLALALEGGEAVVVELEDEAPRA
ncbi:MAG: HRDC domain-containing protein, partial [Alphaproteobacteria bacterium]|nr:HRDC domain-containing protein [Alphaproteobacteria bacterium]